MYVNFSLVKIFLIIFLMPKVFGSYLKMDLLVGKNYTLLSLLSFTMLYKIWEMHIKIEVTQLLFMKWVYCQ